MTKYKYLGRADEIDGVTFLGECQGVRLVPRGPDDPHILVELLGEDDESWFLMQDFSSTWLDELIEKLQEAKRYMEEHAKPDIGKNVPGFPPNHQFGWRFK